MKKYVMLNKKKIILYLYLFCIIGIILLLKTFINDLDNRFQKELLYIFSLVFIIPVFFITSNFINVYKISNQSIIKGTIFSSTINWVDADKIEVSNNMVKIYSSELNTIEVSTKNLVNKDFAILKNEILIIAKENEINLVDVDEKTSSDKPKIKGWLSYILFVTFVNTYNIFIKFLSAIQNRPRYSSDISFILPISKIVIFAIVLIFSVYIIVQFISKKMIVKKRIKQFWWLYAFHIIAMDCINTILKMNDGSFEMGNIFDVSLQAAYAILVTLIIVEYFKISDRVKNTFVN